MGPPGGPKPHLLWERGSGRMVILGIDPGVATVGYGVIDSDKGRNRVLSCGVISTAAGLPLEKRLYEIHRDLETLITQFHPDEAAVEELFFNTNSKTAIAVGQARGVILLTLEQSGVPICGYTPLQVKQAVVGYGRADKKQVMEMTKILLKLDYVPRPDDAADALALALCHAQAVQSLIYRREV